MNSETTQKIETLILESMTDQIVPGLAICVVEGDQITHLKGYGFADLEQRIPFTPDTSYQIGSTSKNLTGFAIAQLLERGLIDLDVSVTAYIPYFQVDHPQSDSITVRHLLGQTSGLPATAFVYERNMPVFDTRASESMVRSLHDLKLERAPGELYEYSNFNYVTLGLILERVSKVFYDDYMLEHVFKPLGMTRTFAPASDMIPAALKPGTGYVHGTHQPNIKREVIMSRAWNSSGLIVSNATDIARYLIAQLNGGVSVTGNQVIGKAALERSHTGLNIAESTLGGECEYCFGWETADREGLRAVEHGGDARTSGSYFLLLPDQKVGVAILMNLVDHGKIQLVYNIVKTMFGLEVEAYQTIPKPESVPSNHFKADSSLWKKFTGEYDTVRGRLEVFVQGSELMLKLAKGNPVGETVLLEAQSDTEFVTRSEVLACEGIPISFEINSSGTKIRCEEQAFAQLEAKHD